VKTILSIIFRRDYFKDYWTGIRGTVKIKPKRRRRHVEKNVKEEKRESEKRRRLKGGCFP